MDCLSAPSKLLAQCFRNFDSTILGLEILSMKNGLSCAAGASAGPLGIALGDSRDTYMCMFVYIYIYIYNDNYKYTYMY